MKTDYHKPTSNAFINNTDHWRLFRERRFAVAGDGEYAAVCRLDLSGLALHDFVASWLVFSDCKLDGSSFRNTDFTFKTTFIECSLKNVDFTKSYGGDDLFYGCDLTGAVFDTSIHWATVNLDRKKIPSYFVGCTISDELRNYLVGDGNIIVDKNEISPAIGQWLDEAYKAPTIEIV